MTAAESASATSGRPDAAMVRPWSWHLSRASAVLLVVLLPLHVVVTFVANDVGATTAASMSARLDDPTWSILTWVTLALALLHGTLSTAAAVGRSRPGRLGTAITALVGVLAGGLLAAATWALVTHG